MKDAQPVNGPYNTSGTKEPKTKAIRQRFKYLDEEFISWWAPHFREISEYMAPRKGRYLQGYNQFEENKGTKKMQKIHNGSPLEAIRIAGAGLQGGLTSPSRPWFSLTLPDQSLMEFGAVKKWLHDVQELILQVFARSNFYTSVHQCYLELIRNGTTTMMIDEDEETVVRFQPFTIGEFRLALNDKLQIDELYRPFSMTAKQIKQKFAMNEDRDAKDSVMPNCVREALRNNHPYQRFDVKHAIMPNPDYVDGKIGPVGMKYRSVYYTEQADSEEQVLSDKGYRTKPFVTARWDVTAGDTYGNGPGMDALPDVKQLNLMEEKKLKALSKMVDPPMQAPTQAKRGSGVTLVPGGITFVDTLQGQQGVSPLYQVNPNLREFAAEIERVETRIRATFSNNLFLAILNEERQMTATEVAQRYEEKLMMLGPVIEGLQSEFLDPIIDRVYDILDQYGLLPPIPRELQNGTQIKVQYTSLLAQAQKMVGTQAIERTVGFIMSLYTVNNEIVDKIDFDELVDQYAMMQGVAPEIIRPDDKVAELRAGRQKQVQMQQMLASAPALNQASQAAKTASETQTQNGQSTLLDRLAGAARPAQ